MFQCNLSRRLEDIVSISLRQFQPIASRINIAYRRTFMHGLPRFPLTQSWLVFPHPGRMQSQLLGTTFSSFRDCHQPRLRGHSKMLDQARQSTPAHRQYLLPIWQYSDVSGILTWSSR